MDKNVPKRIVIYAKDIVNILGKKKSAAQAIMQSMRRQLGKKTGEYITVEEFCQITGIKEQQVYALLKN